jgi:salicylate hydroxylase
VTQPRPILIAGAGIAGLSLALELSRRGLPARILEKRRTLSEAGAGIQLGPNGMRVLARLGLDRRLEPASGKPLAITVFDGASGRIIAELPLGGLVQERSGAPYWVAHRADLHAILLAAVREANSIELVTGFEVVSVPAAASVVRVEAGGGGSAEGHALVGADGLWSAVRRHLFPGREPRFAGKMAVRTVIDASAANGRFAEPKTGIWLGRNAHVVHYPVRAGQAIACVIIFDANRPRLGWGDPIEREVVLRRLMDFAPEVSQFLELAREWYAWSLFDSEPLPLWSKGRVGLIGDAAHPMLPFLAQGGVMALEDAATLAEALAAFPQDPACALRAYEAARWRRVTRVQKASRLNGRVYHLSGLAARLRDLALGAIPGPILMRQYDWLYGWRGDLIPVETGHSAAMQGA